MRFQIHTIYDGETVRELQDTIRESIPASQTKKVRRNLLLAGAACLAGAALLAIGFDNGLMAIVPLMCGVILLFTGVTLRSTMAARREKEARKESPASESDASFTEESFTVRSRRGESSYTYAGCQALLETPRHFILMVGDRRAVALDKAGFLAGAPEEFRTFIQEKTGKSFDQSQER